ncbi:FAD:protein FMN transferase [Sphingomonas sp.]|uniref:FAD:protein FMN transferase n=1 Tax=Sphingomonas sp. TaxID=28214 RepID=UPI0035AF8A4E
MRIALPTHIDPAAFATRDASAPIVTLEGATMGTRWRVLYAAHADPTPIAAAITQTLARIVAEMNHWDADSLLSRFNRAPAGHWFDLPPDFAHVIAAALRIAAASDGAFDPAIGHLVNAHGHGPTHLSGSRDGWHHLAWDAAARRLRQPGGLALDLSGIAKGHAVDAVSHALRRAGLAHALIDIGGELAGTGIRPDGEPWWVDLENPPGAPLVPLRIALHGLAVATSGTYIRGDHNLDPRTGRPAAHGVVAASVIHQSAMEADALATALTVLGHDAGAAFAIRHALAARLVLRRHGTWDEWLSPALLAMLEPQEQETFA